MTAEFSNGCCYKLVSVAERLSKDLQRRQSVQYPEDMNARVSPSDQRRRSRRRMAQVKTCRTLVDGVAEWIKEMDAGE